MTTLSAAHAGSAALETLRVVGSRSLEALTALGRPEAAGEAAAVVGSALDELSLLRASLAAMPTPTAFDGLAGTLDAVEGSLTHAASELAHVSPAGRRIAGATAANPAALEPAMLDLARVQELLAAHVSPPVIASAAPSARPRWATSTFLDQIGVVSGTRTQRLSELPYGVPDGFEVLRLHPGEALDVARLDPSKSYLWSVDAHGTFLLAPEAQPGFGVTRAKPEGRLLKHGDLTPSLGGLHRGESRAGGMLKADPAHSGEWVLDNVSSYSFVRGSWTRPLWEETGKRPFVRGKQLGDDSLRAVRELLERNGTDMSKVAGRTYSGVTIWSPHAAGPGARIARRLSPAVTAVSQRFAALDDLRPLAPGQRLGDWLRARRHA